MVETFNSMLLYALGFSLVEIRGFCLWLGGVNIFPVVFGDFGFMISFHGLVTFLPAGWADFTEFVSVLEGFHQSVDFIDISADWKIIGRVVSQDTLWVNDEGSSKYNSLGDSSRWGIFTGWRHQHHQTIRGDSRSLWQPSWSNHRGVGYQVHPNHLRLGISWTIRNGRRQSQLKHQ